MYIFIIGVLYRYKKPLGKGDKLLQSLDHELYPYHYLRDNPQHPGLDQFMGERTLKLGRRCAFAAYQYFIGSSFRNPTLWRCLYESFFLPKKWGIISHECENVFTPDGDYIEIQRLERESFRRRYSIDSVDSGIISEANSSPRSYFTQYSDIRLGSMRCESLLRSRYSVDVDTSIELVSQVDESPSDLYSPNEIQNYIDGVNTLQGFTRLSTDESSQTYRLLYENGSNQSIKLLRLISKNNGETDYSFYQSCEHLLCSNSVFIIPTAYYTINNGSCNQHMTYHLVGEIRMYDCIEYFGGGTSKVLICTRNYHDVGNILCAAHYSETLRKNV